MACTEHMDVTWNGRYAILRTWVLPSTLSAPLKCTLDSLLGLEYHRFVQVGVLGEQMGSLRKVRTGCTQVAYTHQVYQRAPPASLLHLQARRQSLNKHEHWHRSPSKVASMNNHKVCESQCPCCQ